MKPITPDHELHLLDAMEQYGGGFASSLAVAWRRADSVNRRKLRAAFGGLLESFEAFVEERV